MQTKNIRERTNTYLAVLIYNDQDNYIDLVDKLSKFFIKLGIEGRILVTSGKQKTINCVHVNPLLTSLFIQPNFTKYTLITSKHNLANRSFKNSCKDYIGLFRIIEGSMLSIGITLEYNKNFDNMGVNKLIKYGDMANEYDYLDYLIIYLYQSKII